MNDFTLHIFPFDTLAATVTTTVWVGVCVVVFFNLRLGWSLSGLVVPGYLVPLLIARPISAGVIFIEALATYAITWSVSEGCKRVPGWCSFFGRDRFFALVAFSVLVRAVIDEWLLPVVGSSLNERFELSLDYRNDLHSYGLIIVPLIANYFWKPGILRGLAPLAVKVGTTYLIVSAVLIPFTNFNIGGLHYMYDDVARSLLASPKAYLILLTTAFVASWANLRYGWEFNGILIPALLALQWHHPWKILASFGEAAIIVAVGTPLLHLPLWRGATMTGPRKILLFFTVSFVYRLLAGHLLPHVLPHVVVTEFYGFGYLLATLLAIKAHNLQMALRIARASLQVSIVGAVVASVLGFCLTWIPNERFSREVAAAERATDSEPIEGDLTSRIRLDKVLFYQQQVPDNYIRPNSLDCDRFAEGIKLCLQYAVDRDDRLLRLAHTQLASAHYDLQLVDDRYLYLRERSPGRGWGIYVFDLRLPQGLSVQVPVPLDESSTVEAGLALFRHLNAGSLAIAGANPRTRRNDPTSHLTDPNTFFGTFHRLVGRRNTLQVRGYERHTLAMFQGARRRDTERAAEQLPSSLWVKRALPPGLNVKSLSDVIDGYDVQWQETPWPNRLRDDSPAGFCELILNHVDRRTLVSRLGQQGAQRKTSSPLMIKGYLNEWLFDIKEHVARRGTNAYVSPTPEQLLYMDEEVVQPVLRLTERLTHISAITPEEWDEISVIASTASVFHYQLALAHDMARDEDFVILMEEIPRKCHWGTYVFRLGLREPYVVEVPRPLFDRNAFEFGVTQFSRARAAALLIAGAHPRANRDQSSDVSRPINKLSLFHLVHQSLLREWGTRPMLVVQTRAVRAPVGADVIVATHDGTTPDVTMSPHLLKLTEMLEHDGLRLRFVDGSPEVAEYDVGMTLQALTMDHAENKGLVGLWLSPALRSKFRQNRENNQQAQQFAAVDIPTIERDLFEYLVGLDTAPRSETMAAELREQTQAYLDTQDVVRLRLIQNRWPDYRLLRLIDRSSGQIYLLITTDSEEFPIVVNLSGDLAQEHRTLVAEELNRERIVEFVDSRFTWLEVRATQ